MKFENVKKITMIGAGAMGSGIATCGIMAGYTVALRDVEQKFVDNGVAGVKSSLAKFKEKGKITPEAYDSALSRLIPIVNLQEAVKDADFIIEAVPEKLEIKQSVMAELDKYSPKHAILASNTSNISITEIAKATSRPDRVIGYHFFNPAVLMKLVEITKGAKTSDESVQIGYELAKQMKKVPVIVHKDSPGFIFNRINEPATLLLSLILQDGQPSPEEFDAAMKPLMPMAPFELMDYVGIDIAYHSLDYFAKVLSPEYKPSAAMDSLLNANTLGKKTGKGIYDWSVGRPTIDLAKATKEYDINHLIGLQVNEATKVLAEGVAASAAEIDLAMANGGGSPFGPFVLAQSIGYPVLLAKVEKLYEKFKLEVFKPTEMMKKGDIKV